MEFSRQEYWSELPFPSPGDLPDSGIEPESPALQADSLPSEPPQVVELFSLCNWNAHMRIQLLHLEMLNLKKMTRYSFQKHCLIYVFARHGSHANVGSKM